MVEFTGWLPDAALTALPRFDLFVQSSNWEAMSMVALEAMAAGRPILATAVGDNPGCSGTKRPASWFHRVTRLRFPAE